MKYLFNQERFTNMTYYLLPNSNTLPGIWGHY